MEIDATRAGEMNCRLSFLEGGNVELQGNVWLKPRFWRGGGVCEKVITEGSR